MFQRRSISIEEELIVRKARGMLFKIWISDKGVAYPTKEYRIRNKSSRITLQNLEKKSLHKGIPVMDDKAVYSDKRKDLRMYTRRSFLLAFFPNHFLTDL